MKRILGVICVCFLLLISGCSSSGQTTVCKLNGSNYKYTLNSDGDKMKEFNIEYHVKYGNSATKSNLKSVVSSTKSIYKEYWGKIKGISWKVYYKGKTIYTSVNIDYSKATASGLVKSALFGNATKKEVVSKKAIVKLLKKQKFSCKAS